MSKHRAVRILTKAVLSAALGAGLGLVVGNRTLTAVPTCPENRCNFITGYCYHEAGSNRYCHHVGGEQGCSNTFCS